MLLDHVRELKSSLLSDLATSIERPAMIQSMAIRSQSISSEAQALRSIALGVAHSKKQHVLAVRVQRRMFLNHPLLERIRKAAKNEVDVRYVGRISKLETAASLQRRRRPLVIGCSIGHFEITAGTLGCFVKPRGGEETLILSNNHVLANENDAKIGDAILQPGRVDGGRKPSDVIARLRNFVPLKIKRANLVDCAVAQLSASVTGNVRKLGRFGALKGLGPDFLDEGTAVHKVGRTTGETTGSITAFEMDNVVVNFDLGNLRFDNQIEIQGAGTSAFSDGGDSGSLIVTQDNLGVGLLFAGGDEGGSNGMGLTYANPLKAVLDALKVELIL